MKSRLADKTRVAQESRLMEDRLDGRGRASAVGRKVGAGARGLGELQVAEEGEGGQVGQGWPSG